MGAELCAGRGKLGCDSQWGRLPSASSPPPPPPIFFPDMTVDFQSASQAVLEIFLGNFDNIEIATLVIRVTSRVFRFFESRTRISRQQSVLVTPFFILGVNTKSL